MALKHHQYFSAHPAAVTTCLSQYPMRPIAVFSNKGTKSEFSLRILPQVTQGRSNAAYSYESEDGAVLRNIEACRAIAQTVQTSLGPYGRNKIVINHLQKMILTSDAATILRELDVVHPAAKLIVMASQQQEAEMGDATNMVIVLAGELLKKAEELLRMGLKASDIVQGYERAQREALKILDRMCPSTAHVNQEDMVGMLTWIQNSSSMKSKT